MKQLLNLFLFICFICELCTSQNIKNLHLKKIKIKTINDTIKIDTNSIVPNSLSIICLKDKHKLDYYIDYSSSKIFFKNFCKDSILIKYRTFPYNFSKEFKHKQYSINLADLSLSKNPYIYNIPERTNVIPGFAGLNKKGSISRGISFGNNQDLSVNSNFNLELSGKLTNDINIMAVISDENLPIQPEGNTQQLQEFDKVFIKLFNNKTELIAGDYQMKQKINNHFLKFYKRTQGANFSNKYTLSKDNLNNEERGTIYLSAAISKGKFARNIIKGIEGNQGPYKLKGAENENFIIILSGTERIFLDGKLLTRGQDNDYVIDYNTAEITFTPNVVINTNSRIIAEFQYTDKNYARSLFYVGNIIHQRKIDWYFNIYSEQDLKNQPLQRQFTKEEKLLLDSIGDSIQKAIVPNIQLIDTFKNDEVLYKTIDTVVNNIVYKSIFVFSTNPDSAKYRVSFSYVGENKGNYIQIKSTANGKVYKWVAPENGVLQGNYEPQSTIITPKKKQMFVLGANYNLSSNSKLAFEAAISNNDLNTMSKKDDADDKGLAFSVSWSKQSALQYNKINPWLINTTISLEQVDKKFNYIERFRSTEFTRDWVLGPVKPEGNQSLSNFNINLNKKDKANFNYTFSSLIYGNSYSGFNNNFAFKLSPASFIISSEASYLIANGNYDINYFKYKSKLAKSNKIVLVGITQNGEYSIAEDKINNKKISGNFTQGGSFSFWEGGAFIQNPDSSLNKYKIMYSKRFDNRLKNDKLARAMESDNISAFIDIRKYDDFKIKIKSSYRKLQIITPDSRDTLLSNNNKNTFLNRLEYRLNILKNLITTNSFYELASGQEAKKEYRFIEVSAGQGIYTWTDYNKNGIKELNEFEVAKFSDQAKYIKVFTPTSQYVQTFNNSFSQIIWIRPFNIIKSKLIEKLSNQFAVNINRKTANKNNVYNPFAETLKDSTLISSNAAIRNVFSINRTGKTGIDYNYQKISGKSITTNGFETRENFLQGIKIRSNVGKYLTFYTILEQGNKILGNDFFKNKNYAIKIINFEPKVDFQPNINTRFSISFNYKEKKNAVDLGGEEAYLNKSGIEFKYFIPGKGNLLLNFNYIFIKYNGDINTTVAYEMLEALQKGENYLWSATYQKNIKKYLQINLNYNGRKSRNSQIIHTGGVQVRAFF